MGDPCTHDRFRAVVNVNRFEDRLTMTFNAEVRITCSDCGEPFHFVGVPPGLSWEGPTVGINSVELKVPIAPGERWWSGAMFQAPPPDTKGNA